MQGRAIMGSLCLAHTKELLVLVMDFAKSVQLVSRSCVSVALLVSVWEIKRLTSET